MRALLARSRAFLDIDGRSSNHPDQFLAISSPDLAASDFGGDLQSLRQTLEREARTSRIPASHSTWGTNLK